MLRLLPSKLLEVTIFDQMINMAIFLFILIEMTIGAPISYTRINVSLFLLKYTNQLATSCLFVRLQV